MYSTPRSPDLEYFLVAQQDVAARFQVILLLDAFARDRLADGEPVPVLDERHVIDDEHAGLLDASQVLDRPLGADRAVAAAVKGPGAAERAIPGAAARELDRSAWIERAHEVPAAMTEDRAPATSTSRLSTKRARSPSPSRVTTPGMQWPSGRARRRGTDRRRWLPLPPSGRSRWRPRRARESRPR